MLRPKTSARIPFPRVPLPFTVLSTSMILPLYILLGTPSNDDSVLRGVPDMDLFIVLRERQNTATGHTSQPGALAVHIVAPMSINAWFQSYARPFGKRSSAADQISDSPFVSSTERIFQRRRERNLRTFTSTTGVSTANAAERRAFAVYRPMPGRARRASAVRGNRPPWIRTTVCASWCNLTALLLYPIPCHAITTSRCLACASDLSVGNLRRNPGYLINTRATCVCCNMTSEIRILYGLVMLRQGRVRP